MFSLISLSNDACRRAAQLFITILIILVLGKLITLVPVMHQLYFADTFKAAEIVWFLTKLAALVVFYLFARCTIEAIPNNGGTLSFLRGIVEPLTVLVIVIIGQALFWQVLTPFVDEFGKTVYYSVAITLIVSVSIWLVLRAYQNAVHIVDATGNMYGILSRFIPKKLTVCQQCHAEISSNDSFCSQCGHKMQEPVCCSKCGEEVLYGQSYCHSCGSALKEIS